MIFYWRISILVLVSAAIAAAHSSNYSREQFAFKNYTASTSLGYYTQTECGELEIDHVVSLLDAWNSGAQEWDSEEREVFANDCENHVAACKSVNRSKGSASPTVFRERSQDGKGFDYKILNWCAYLSRYIAIKNKYNLQISLTTEEALLRSCKR